MSSLVIILASFPAMLWSGYVGSVLWTWFIEPMGAPHIGAVRMAGIAIVASVVRAKAEVPTHEPTGKKFDGAYRAGVFLILWTVVPLIALGWGWVVKQFM